MSKRYIVYGEDSGELGEYKTIKEAKKAIAEAKKFDLKNLGYTDTFTIEEVE